jgi:hypothetical protein
MVGINNRIEECIAPFAHAGIKAVSHLESLVAG